MFTAPDRIQALNGSSYHIFTGTSRSLGGGQPATIRYSPQDVADATDFVLGASLAVSRGFLGEVGLMQEDYFLYFEEIDWAVRNSKLGSHTYETAFAYGATVFHKAGRSIGSGSARFKRKCRPKRKNLVHKATKKHKRHKDRLVGLKRVIPSVAMCRW